MWCGSGYNRRAAVQYSPLLRRVRTCLTQNPTHNAPRRNPMHTGYLGIGQQLAARQGYVSRVRVSLFALELDVQLSLSLSRQTLLDAPCMQGRTCCQIYPPARSCIGQPQCRNGCCRRRFQQAQKCPLFCCILALASAIASRSCIRDSLAYCVEFPKDTHLYTDRNC